MNLMLGVKIIGVNKKIFNKLLPLCMAVLVQYPVQLLTILQ